MQVTCQKTGLTFEAQSKRTKNYPAIMTVVNQANKEGWYNQCLETLSEGRKAGLDTFDAFLDLLKETREAALNQQMVDYRVMLAQKCADKERRMALYQSRYDREPFTFEGDRRDAFQVMMDDGE